MKKEIAIQMVTQLVLVERAIYLETHPDSDSREYKGLAKDEKRIVETISNLDSGKEFLRLLKKSVDNIMSQKKSDSTSFGLLSKSHVYGTLSELEEYLDEKDLLTVKDIPQRNITLDAVAERLNIYGNTSIQYTTYLTLGEKTIAKRLKTNYNIGGQIKIRQSQQCEPFNFNVFYKNKKGAPRTFYSAVMPTIVIALVKDQP